jgi:hypothetical protein
VGEYDLKDLMQSVGPNAPMIFAAWIFLSYLQQRYSTAYDRYRALIGEYRSADLHEVRRRSLRDQILMYKHRCEEMKLATNFGVASALVLICTLITAALFIVFPHATPLKHATTALALVGLVLVMIAGAIVLRENVELQQAIDSELTDLPDLAEPAGVAPGTMPAEQPT